MLHLPLYREPSPAPVAAHGPVVLDGAPLVVAYGMGVDSTALLVGLHQRGIRPDLILFADTGNEWPETYAYLPIMQAWLASVGFPLVQRVQRVVHRFKNEPYTTLETNCLSNSTLPSLAFGRKACSEKWKRQPQDKFCKTWGPAVETWARGGKVIKAIGYDAGPKDSKRAWKLTDDAKYRYWYPLRQVAIHLIQQQTYLPVVLLQLVSKFVILLGKHGSVRLGFGLGQRFVVLFLQAPTHAHADEADKQHGSAPRGIRLDRAITVKFHRSPCFFVGR